MNNENNILENTNTFENIEQTAEIQPADIPVADIPVADVPVVDVTTAPAEEVPIQPVVNEQPEMIDNTISNTLNESVVLENNVVTPTTSEKELFSGMVTFDYNNVPITDIVNSIILDAINKGSSDIHFDPFDDGIKIRIRIDGILHDYSIVPLFVKKNMITRIKIISGMNITESRTPQDGAIRTELQNKTIDLRVSCLPTNLGEKIVIRIMDYSMSAQGIESLDFEESNLEKIKKMLSLPNGIILVTGATGSGKSTTVYTMLQKLNVEGTNIVTVEDPIEMNINGINQVQAQSEIGLDFATVLRSILRQDPDVIMIGEIRDNETARIAVRASITGHLVLSTIHTNNSLSTIERLTDMDVERYLLGTSLSGIVSQKLARRLCNDCKRLRPTTEYEKETIKKVLNIEVNEIYEPVGCPHCSRGYKGRIAIHEVLYITQAIRDAITSNVKKEVLRHAVYSGENPTKTMLQDGLSKVVKGITSFDEILKLIDLDDDLGSNTQLGLDDQINAAQMNRENELNNTPIVANSAVVPPININITPELLSGLNLGNINTNNKIKIDNYTATQNDNLIKDENDFIEDNINDSIDKQEENIIEDLDIKIPDYIDEYNDDIKEDKFNDNIDIIDDSIKDEDMPKLVDINEESNIDDTPVIFNLDDNKNTEAMEIPNLIDFDKDVSKDESIIFDDIDSSETKDIPNLIDIDDIDSPVEIPEEIININNSDKDDIIEEPKQKTNEPNFDEIDKMINDFLGSYNSEEDKKVLDNIDIDDDFKKILDNDKDDKISVDDDEYKNLINELNDIKDDDNDLFDKIDFENSFNPFNSYDAEITNNKYDINEEI